MNLKVLEGLKEKFMKQTYSIDKEKFICFSFFMKLSVIVALFLFSSSIYAAKVTGTGRAVIINNNLKEAEKNAKVSALTNSIANYFDSFKQEKNLPGVTEEFIKFIKSYRILKRDVSQFVVTYDIEADIDDMVLGDFKYYINRIVNSVVFSIFEDNLTDENLYLNLKKTLIEELQRFNFDTKYQSEYDIQTPNDASINDKLMIFANSGAKYFFQISPEISCSYIDKSHLCKLSLTTTVYSKSEVFPPIKALASGIGKTETEALKLAFKKASVNTITYIADNQLKLIKENTEEKVLNMSLLNFGSFSEVYDLLNILKGKGVLKNYTLKTYSQGVASFEVSTKFNLEDLVNKISATKVKQREVFVETDSDALIVNFK